MTHEPTGRLAGNDLTLSRTFRNAPVADVWASVTDPQRTARWFGRWEGEPGAGSTIRVQMAFEQDAPWMDATIEVCDAPHRLALTTGMAWRLELRLSQVGDDTELVFVHHLKDREGVGEIGPGWEYYLDMLVAARADRELPTFDQYYPAQKPYYAGLADSA
ncbi:MAG: SRPBCC family protein [Myxococcota bacterium]